VSLADWPEFVNQLTHFFRSVFQLIGGALFVSAAENIFANRLLISVPSHAPGIIPAAVLNTGASSIQNGFPAEDVAGIYASYMIGLKAAWAMGLALAAAALLASFGPEMRSIKTKKKSG
jgi:hypothetical protein